VKEQLLYSLEVLRKAYSAEASLSDETDYPIARAKLDVVLDLQTELRKEFPPACPVCWGAESVSIQDGHVRCIVCRWSTPL
jgi:hypothetical protein